MKVLVVGSGGREHALAWKLSQEADVVAAPGNPGIAECARCVSVATSDHSGLVDLARRESVGLVVIGPEDPLIAGLADATRAASIPAFGPGADGAQLEGSKAFSKQLMREAGIRTAAFETFDDAAQAHAYVESQSGKLVVKASGAALGKGVIVTENATEAHDAVDAMLVDGEFGAAGRTIVIEERLSGPEFSLLTLCSGDQESKVQSPKSKVFLSLPVAQDYKRAFDGDRGPNTGGMGTFSPVPWITDRMVGQTEDDVVRPILAALQARGISYRGVLFSGLMLHEGKTHCLEFNVRFGDPEIQSIVLRLGSGLAAALLACAKGEPIPPVDALDNAAVSVVVASGGYPGRYEKGKPIEIGAMPDGVHVFHAGTAMTDGQLVTNGGRVLAVSASAPDIKEARRLAYEAVEGVRFEGKQNRQDIALGAQL
ncbi:MAG: phosphoribosylamine--glycine ligase [Fimbriimonadales bacterium]